MDAAGFGRIADDLEAELRRLGWWGSPAPAGPVTSAFGGRDMSFAQWLEHVLCPRLREIAAGEADPPGDSQVAPYAVRELDGYDEAGPVLDVLRRLDELVAAVNAGP